MSKNGKTFVNFLTPVVAGSSYFLNLTYYTCGNKKMCVSNNDSFPLVDNLSVQVIGAPRLIPNTSVYCCDVLCKCDLTYKQAFPNNGGCYCCKGEDCYETEKVVASVCVPLTSADVPTISEMGVLANPVSVGCGCYYTNEVVLDIAFAFDTTTQNTNNGD